MRTVIKVGTSTLTYKNGCVNLRSIERLCRILADMKNAGNEIILVSSGAIATGVGKLNLSEKPKDIAGKQAAAAVGQCELMYIYDKEFSSYNHTIAQILLTAPDLECEDRLSKFKNTVEKLFELGALPIINENDTVATEEIEFGDNDTLAARVATSVGAELLVLMSDIDGLYDKDPHRCEGAELIPEVYEITPEIEAASGGAGTERGTGGMMTKIKAAKIATERGCDMIIANGAYPELLYKLMEGEAFGTRFYAKN